MNDPISDRGFKREKDLPDFFQNKKRDRIKRCVRWFTVTVIYVGYHHTHMLLNVYDSYVYEGYSYLSANFCVNQLYDVSVYDGSLNDCILKSMNEGSMNDCQPSYTYGGSRLNNPITIIFEPLCLHTFCFNQSLKNHF